ncbi:hypothetical protein M434DRAFT_9846 [Hypoxylon sp. CO27-5]|nr:hypothetical protein M434DRAFT_9846 [Hypoxylon sp. CO27-5]
MYQSLPPPAGTLRTVPPAGALVLWGFTGGAVAMQVDLQASQQTAVTRGSAYVELAAVAWLSTSRWCSNAQGPKQMRVWVGLRWSGRKGPGVTNAQADWVWAIKMQKAQDGDVRRHGRLQGEENGNASAIRVG